MNSHNKERQNNSFLTIEFNFKKFISYVQNFKLFDI